MIDVFYYYYLCSRYLNTRDIISIIICCNVSSSFPKTKLLVLVLVLVLVLLMLLLIQILFPMIIVLQL